MCSANLGGRPDLAYDGKDIKTSHVRLEFSYVRYQTVARNWRPALLNLPLPVSVLRVHCLGEIFQEWVEVPRSDINVVLSKQAALFCAVSKSLG